MIDFSLQIPTRTEFGRNIIDSVGAEVKAFGQKALFLYGRNSIKSHGTYERIISSLTVYGMDWVEHPGVSPNPKLAHAFRGSQLARLHDVDVIVAVGGGSVIDEAKAIALGFYTSSQEELWSFYTRDAVPSRALPIVAVMTMPATSSENNSASVITHDETKEKFSVKSTLIAPRVSILDPELTLNIPLEQTAYACTDIISHLSEGYFTHHDSFSPVQEEFSLGMIKAVVMSMRSLMNDPKDINARSAFMWAASLGWNGLGVAGWQGAQIPCHTLEHPISGLYEIPHGAGLSITTLAFLNMRKDAISKRIITFGRKVFDLDESCDADDVLMHLKHWYEKIGTPVSFRDWNASLRPDVGLLIKEAQKLDHIWNASDLSAEEFRTAYNSML